MHKPGRSSQWNSSNGREKENQDCMVTCGNWMRADAISQNEGQNWEAEYQFNFVHAQKERLV